MTIRVARIIEKCDVVVGYRAYVELLKKIFPDKEYLSTPMGAEEQRCRMCFEEALKGKKAVIACSGDAGIYGMAGLMLNVGEDYPGIEVEIAPGVTAASSGAALLGAPLMGDFAVISLSDLLVPWEKIEMRLGAAASSEMAICLYNPSSRNRRDHLLKACGIIMKYRPPETVCGVAENIGREGERIRVCSLKDLEVMSLNMFATIFIGTKKTAEVRGRMVTPRGYAMGGGRVG